ncbi:PAS domain S-box protein [Trichothermofontia sp.]
MSASPLDAHVDPPLIPAAASPTLASPTYVAAYQLLLDDTLMARIDRQGIYQDYMVTPGSAAVGTPATRIGRSLRDELPPDLAQQYWQQLQQALATGTLQQSEYTQTIAGEVRHYVARMAPCGPDEVLLMVRDITAQKRTEAALRQAEQTYRSIFDNALEGIFQTTPAGQYLSANLALARIYGYDSPAELMAQFTDIAHQLYVDPNRREAFVHQMQTQGIVSHFESQVYRKDGSILWIEEHARAVRDENGQILYYEGMVEDITQRKQAEAIQAANAQQLQAQQAELARSLSILQATLEATADGILVTDSAWNVVNYNQQFVTMWGIPAEILATGSREQELNFILEQLKQPETFLSCTLDLEEQPYAQGHDCFELKDGRVFERHYRPQYLDGQVVGRVWSFRDITEQTRIERLKDEFVSMVSHELRTPLTSIRGSLGLILGGVSGDVPEQTRMLLEIAYKNSERLITLINDILDIEKIESGRIDFNLQPLELTPLLTQAIATNQTYADQFQVRLVLTETVPVRVNADPDRLLQVLTNLLSNAAKFSPTGSVVEVSAQRLESRTDWVRVAVRDYGPGIPAAFIPHIFQKFAQADSSNTRQKGGTGLGLSITKAIVERLGGTIGFETEPGIGTTFYFDLPLLLEPTSSPPATVLPATHRSHLLICEDDPDIATLLNLILQQGGFHCDIAQSAAEAKQLLTQRSYDAMTVDLVLPDQDGISLIRDVRSQFPSADLPIVVVSAQSRSSGEGAAQTGQPSLQNGDLAVTQWLDKPIDHQQLLTVVQQAVAQSSATRPRILHVEDDPDILQVTTVILRDLAEVVPAPSLAIARQQLQTQTFDLILLDWTLPDGSGLDLLHDLHKLVATSATVVLSPSANVSSGKVTPPPIPVVIFSAQDLNLETAHQVAATLVKSRTSNQELIQTIQNLVEHNPPSALVSVGEEGERVKSSLHADSPTSYPEFPTRLTPNP